VQKLKPIIKRIEKRSDWRELKLLFEHFQCEYVNLLFKNLHLCGEKSRFKFGPSIDCLNELRYLTQDFLEEMQFAEMMEECFGDISDPEMKGAKRNEKFSKNRL